MARRKCLLQHVVLKKAGHCETGHLLQLDIGDSWAATPPSELLAGTPYAWLSDELPVKRCSQ